MQAKRGVLFVCTANICRSPLAEAVLRQKAATAALADRLWIDSAGTHAFRVGEPPDATAQRVAARRGYDLSGRQARRIARSDLERFEYVLAMDMANMSALHRLGEPDLWQKPKLLMSYSRLYREREVADPYGMDEDRFELVLDMIESAVDGLFAALCAELRDGR